MVFEVLHCTEADMLKCAEMYRDSFNFQEHPLLDALLPNIDTLEGRQSAAARLAAALETPNSHHLKVVDAETGEMLCRGRWVFLPALDEDQARDVAFVMKDEDVVDSDTFGKWMLERYQVTLNNKRRQSEKALWYLSSLTTPPQNAGRGAGSALLKWGMEKADESGIEVCREPLRENSCWRDVLICAVCP